MKEYNRTMRTAATYGILMTAFLRTTSPIYWMIKPSLIVDEEIYVARPSLFSNVIAFDHYIDLIYNTPFIHNVWDSSMIATITTIICLATDILGSYAMTQLKYPRRSFSRSSVIVSYLTPTAVLFVPMYMFVSNLGFYDNRYSLLVIYPTFVVPRCCYILINYFKAVPHALEEATLMNNRNRLQTLWCIIVPIALPGAVMVTTFAFTMAWNEYLYAMIMTTNNVQKTAAVAISGSKYADSAIWGGIMNASVACSLPVTLLYTVTQSMLISSRHEGSVK